MYYCSFVLCTDLPIICSHKYQASTVNLFQCKVSNSREFLTLGMDSKSFNVLILVTECSAIVTAGKIFPLYYCNKIEIIHCSIFVNKHILPNLSLAFIWAFNPIKSNK